MLVTLALALSQAAPPALRLERDPLFAIARYNRAEGLSLGHGATLVQRGRMTVFAARGRYGLHDERPQGLVAIRRDDIGGRFEVAVFREMRDADPLAPGLTIENSVAALLLSHDDGSYVFASGISARRGANWRRHADITATLTLAEEREVRAAPAGGLSGDFQPNTPVVVGRFATLLLAAEGGEPERTWFAGFEATAGAADFVRGWAGGARTWRIGGGMDVMLFALGGAGGGDRIAQRQFRLGGTRTLRGYPAGTLRGAAAWAVGLDVGAAHRVVAPVLFADVGQAAGNGEALASVGMGLSALRGMIRMHFAKPLGSGRARFDLVFGARR